MGNKMEEFLNKIDSCTSAEEVQSLAASMGREDLDLATAEDLLEGKISETELANVAHGGCDSYELLQVDADSGCQFWEGKTPDKSCYSCKHSYVYTAFCERRLQCNKGHAISSALYPYD